MDPIEQSLSLTPVQLGKLNALKDASDKAVKYLQESCPTNDPATPTGRVDAMEQRLEAMLEAVREVQPALQDFYVSLTDEQKARLNAYTPGTGIAARKPGTGIATRSEPEAVAPDAVAPGAVTQRAVAPRVPQRPVPPGRRLSRASVTTIVVGVSACGCRGRFDPPLRTGVSLAGQSNEISRGIRWGTAVTPLGGGFRCGSLPTAAQPSAALKFGRSDTAAFGNIGPQFPQTIEIARIGVEFGFRIVARPTAGFTDFDEIGAATFGKRHKAVPRPRAAAVGTVLWSHRIASRVKRS